MKQNIFKSAAIAAVIALTGAVFTSCGGGSGSNSGSSSDSQGLATDGILGSFPQKYFECMDGINTARADLAVGTEQEREAAIKGLLTFDCHKTNRFSEEECSLMMGLMAHFVYEILESLKFVNYE